jgi:hypothetical protein
MLSLYSAIGNLRPADEVATAIEGAITTRGPKRDEWPIARVGSQLLDRTIDGVNRSAQPEIVCIRRPIGGRSEERGHEQNADPGNRRAQVPHKAYEDSGSPYSHVRYLQFPPSDLDYSSNWGDRIFIDTNQSINLVLFALHETPLCNPVHTDKHTLSRRHLRKHQTLPLVQRLPSQTRFWENLPIPSMKRF